MTALAKKMDMKAPQPLPNSLNLMMDTELINRFQEKYEAMFQEKEGTAIEVQFPVSAIGEISAGWMEGNNLESARTGDDEAFYQWIMRKIEKKYGKVYVFPRKRKYSVFEKENEEEQMQYYIDRSVQQILSRSRSSLDEEQKEELYYLLPGSLIHDIVYQIKFNCKNLAEWDRLYKKKKRMKNTCYEETATFFNLFLNTTS